MKIELSKVHFECLIPKNNESESYYLEIKAASKNFRETEPVQFEEFCKSVIEEEITMGELRKFKNVLVGIYRKKND